MAIPRAKCRMRGKVDSSPGERCAEEPGYIRPVLVAGPPVYAWVVTGSFLFGSPPRRVRGCLRPPLRCQLRFEVPAVFRWARVRDTLTTSRPCRQCSFYSTGSTVDCVSCGLVLLSCGVVEYHVVRQIACGGPGGCLPHSFHPATGNVFGTRIGPGV